MEIIILIARIILLILQGSTAAEAVSGIAKKSGVSFSTLWGSLPDIYKLM